MSGDAYHAALVRNFAYYIDLIRIVDGPVLGAWDDERLVGGLLASTPESPDWTDAQEALTNEFGREIDPNARARLLAFESLLDKHVPRLGFPCFYIDTIAVHPDYQGKGCARVLIEYISDLSHRHPTSGAVCLSTENEKNHSFYEHLGFEIVSRATLETITSTSFKRMT